MSRRTDFGTIFCLFIFTYATLAQNVDHVSNNQSIPEIIERNFTAEEKVDTTNDTVILSKIENGNTTENLSNLKIKPPELREDKAFKFKNTTEEKIVENSNISLSENVDTSQNNSKIYVEENKSQTFNVSSLSDGRKKAILNYLNNKGINVTNESELYKISPRFIESSSDFFEQFQNEDEKAKSSFTQLIEKRLNTQPKIIPLNEHNVSDLFQQEKRENYGVSVLLSSDILALRSVVETFKPSLCKNESLLLLESLLSGRLWALKMYDACAKSPTGLLYGNTFQLGNFDECISVGWDDDSVVQGQYCVANVELMKNTLPTNNSGKRIGPREDIHWAVCVPASCSSDVVETFLSKLLLKSSRGGKVQVPESNCYKKQPLKVDSNDIIYASIIGVFTVFIIGCTAYHFYLIYLSRRGEKVHETLATEAILAFSVAKNLKKIFSVKKRQDLELDAIAGIKTYSMFIILCGHALMFILSGPVTNTIFYEDMLKRVQNSLIVANPLLVDTFFLISAFLFCRLLLLEFDKRKGQVNVIAIYLFRYLRVTPAYVVIIGLTMTWLDRLNEGPLWTSRMTLEKERCLESWWTNLLYINNYVNTDNFCMFQSWYLSADTQLFFLAPGIIYPLWKWPKVGEWLLGIVTGVTAFIPFIITYWDRLDPTLLPYPKEVNDLAQNFYFKNVYIKTHMRAVSYCMGLTCGYILYRIQTSGYKFKRNVLWTCWILATIFGMSSIFSIVYFFQPDYVYNPLTTAIYSSLHRVAWAAASGWLLIACTTNNCGAFGQVFLWKPLIPLCRLTYCAYLVNGVVELNAYGTLRDSTYLSIFNLFFICLTHVIQTFAGALILCVMFESPIHGFEKILLKKILHKKKPAGSKENLEQCEEKS